MKKRFAFNIHSLVKRWRTLRELEETSHGVLRGCEMVALPILCIFATYAPSDYLLHLLLTLCCALSKFFDFLFEV